MFFLFIVYVTAQKRSALHKMLRIWSHLLEKPLMENIIFVQCVKKCPLTSTLTTPN